MHFFFGTHWHTSLVLVVLTVFAVGLGVGALGMVPRWWMQRSAARRALKNAQESAGNPDDTTSHGL